MKGYMKMFYDSSFSRISISENAWKRHTKRQVSMHMLYIVVAVCQTEKHSATLPSPTHLGLPGLLQVSLSVCRPGMGHRVVSVTVKQTKH